MKAIWTKKDIGCYADGANGRDHIRYILTELLEQTPATSETIQVIEELEGNISEDVFEEIEAVEILNDYCLGCCFEMIDGDLILMESNE